MSKKYDDDFFSELDKTTDLLKAFKPHVESEPSEQKLDDLYQISTSNDEKSDRIQKQQKLDEILEQKKQQKEQLRQQQLIQQQKQQKEQEEIRKEQARKLEQQLLQSKKKKEEQQQVSKQQKQQENLQAIFSTKQQAREEKKQEKTDISEIVEKINESVEETKRRASKKQRKIEEKQQKKKEKAKFSPFEVIFCSLSFLFILGCFGVYGSRLLKYYRIYNPKGVNGDALMLLTTAIGKNNKLVYEGDGLYMSGGEYVYKGNEVDNYIIYSDLTWRILKTNTDGSIDIVLDDYINSMPWANRAKTYLESDVHKYLNEYFIKYLDTSYLAKTTICKDEVNNIKGFTCNNKNEDYYVRLLSVNEFLNSKTDSTFISNENEALWLNTVSSDKTWQINGASLSLADTNRILGIKPVVKLKSGVALISGDGSKENPYLLKEKNNDIYLGSHVKLGTDVYVVYNIDGDYLDLALSRVLPIKYRFNLTGGEFNPTAKGTMAYYFNTSLMSKMAYKNLLVEKEWNIGKYESSYSDVTSKTVKAKVGALDLIDLKFDNDLQDYFILANAGEKVFVYGNESVVANPAVYQNMRPAIRIKKISPNGGDGSKTNPFVLGA